MTNCLPRCPGFVLAALVALALFAPAAHLRAQTTPPALALVNIYSFGGGAGTGDDPTEGLIRGGDGNFYGSAYDGGSANQGTIFRITQEGVFTLLYTFTGLEGKHPGALVQDGDGNLYGTSSQGGTSDRGTVFRLSPDGALTTLHTFATGESEFYNSGLIRDYDGTLYGATEGGGTSNTGTIYKLTPQGTFTVLHQFDVNPGNAVSADGLYPRAGLIRGNDGNFYGTTARGGTSGSGTVFSITPRGVLTTLHSFTPGEGSFPSAPLLQAGDGNFYGTTYGYFPGTNTTPEIYAGVNQDGGSIFKMTPDGVLSVLSAVPQADYFNPHGQLLQAAGGTIYGTSENGGQSGSGSIFSLAADGKFNPFVVSSDFYEFTGEYLDGSIVQGDDGNLYGVCREGGVYHYGGIFRLDFAPSYLSFTTSEITVGEQAGSVVVRVHRSGDSHGVVTTRCETSDDIDDNKDGGSDIDFTYTKKFLSWADGDMTDKTFTVPILDRGVYDGSTRPFRVDLTDVSGGTFVITPTFCRVSIQEAKATVPSVTLTATVAQASAGSGEVAEAQVNLPAAQDTDVIVNYAVGGTATGGADYAALKGSARIKAGKTSRTIKVAPLGASLVGKRSVVLTLQPGNGYTIGTTGKIKLKITGQ